MANSRSPIPPADAIVADRSIEIHTLYCILSKTQRTRGRDLKEQKEENIRDQCAIIRALVHRIQSEF